MIALAYRFIGLTAKAVMMYPSILVRRAWGARAFKRELIRKQIDSDTVDKLTEIYLDIGKLRQLIRLKSINVDESTYGKR